MPVYIIASQGYLEWGQRILRKEIRKYRHKQCHAVSGGEGGEQWLLALLK